MISGASPITFKLRASAAREEPLTGRQRPLFGKQRKITPEATVANSFLLVSEPY